MSCTFTEKLDQYVDGELPQAEAAQLQSHLRNCRSCAAEALQRMHLKRSIHSAAVNAFVPSGEFRARVVKSVSPPARRGWIWQPMLAFASVIVVLLGAVVWARHSSRSEVFSEIVDLHVTTIASANPVDVISSDKHTVKPWFEGKLPFTFNLPELQNTEFRLIGGRVAYVRQSPAAELVFAIRKHEISVFIFQDRNNFADGSGLQRSGFALDSWSEHGLRYIVISDANADDVRALSRLLRSAER